MSGLISFLALAALFVLAVKYFFFADPLDVHKDLVGSKGPDWIPSIRYLLSSWRSKNDD